MKLSSRKAQNPNLIFRVILSSFSFRLFLHEIEGAEKIPSEARGIMSYEPPIRNHGTRDRTDASARHRFVTKTVSFWECFSYTLDAEHKRAKGCWVDDPHF